jgi:hypothetical protein
LCCTPNPILVKSDDILQKISKNVIIHHYEYSDRNKELEKEIATLEQQLHDKKKQRNATLTILLPNSHSIFTTGMTLLNREHEWSTYFTTKEGERKQRRELVYIEKITQNADLTAIVDEKARWVMDCDGEDYTALEGIFYGKKSILKLSGLDIKDIK